MDPQQELFTAILLASKLLYDTYDGALPEEGTPYPFVYLSDSTMNDVNYKNAVDGEVRQVIDVWHSDYMKRGTVSGMLLNLKKIAYAIEEEGTPTFSWQLRDVNQTIFADTSTGRALLHGRLELTFYFS